MKKLISLLVAAMFMLSQSNAQILNIVDGFTEVFPRPGPPSPQGYPTVEFPFIHPSNQGEYYCNKFWKIESATGKFVEVLSAGVGYQTPPVNEWGGYCVNCTVADVGRIFRAVTLSCTNGGQDGCYTLPVDSAITLTTNNCTVSTAWSANATWDHFRTPTHATTGIIINRSMNQDVNFTLDNKTIKINYGSTLSIDPAVTMTLKNGQFVTDYAPLGQLVNNGKINGTGNFSTLTNNGILEPGISGIGSFLIQGSDFKQSALGSLNLQLGSATSFDYIYLSGSNSTLNGTLNVSLLNGFKPVTGNSFRIIELETGSVSTAAYAGTFASTNLPALSTGLKWKINYNPKSVTLTVVDCSQFSATYTKSDTGCSGTAVGSIFTTPVNGTAPFMYKISSSGAYSSGNPINNLRAGNYRVYTIDNNGCTTISPVITINTHAAVTGTATASAVCHDSMGTMIVTPGGGTSPFRYRLGTTGNFVPSNTFRVKAGINIVSIMDAYGCIGSAKASFVNPAAITATTTATSASPCSNSTNGSIVMTPTSGVSPYLYKKKVTDSYGASNTFSGLAAGTYKVYMKDANSCEIIKSVVVAAPPPVVVSFTPVDPTCTNPTGGSITLGALQSPNATFRLNPGSSVYTSQYVYSGLATGIYYGYAKNTAGCLGRTSAIFLVPPTGCRNSFAEGKLQTANETGSNGLSVSLYPNPTKGAFTLQLNGKKTGRAEVTVTSESGVLIENRSVKTTATNQLLQFNFAGKPSGIYFIKVVSEQGVQTSKVVVE